MAGDMSDYAGDRRRADLAQFATLSPHQLTITLPLTQRSASELPPPEKVGRADYKAATILKAIKAEPIFDAGEESPSKMTDRRNTW